MTNAILAAPLRSLSISPSEGGRSAALVHLVPTQPVLLSLTQLARHCGIEEADLLDLVDHGVLSPTDTGSHPWQFNADCMANLRQARRMRQDLALDEHGFALVLMCLNRISGLESSLHRLRSELRHLGSAG